MNIKLIQQVLFKSLKARLVMSALLVILVLLPLIGITLNDAFKQQVNSAAESELSAYIYSILAVAEVENNQLQMPELLLENQFNTIQSGLYAFISMSVEADVDDQKNGTQGNPLAWYSDSFTGFNPPQNLPQPAIGIKKFGTISIEGRPHIIQSFSASFEHTSGTAGLTLHIIKDQAEFQQQINTFNRTLWSWLLFLTILLVVVQLAWLLWTLKPLARFKKELQDVENGVATQLSDRYPSELQAVGHQLNALLLTEQNQRKRYRNALSDLAHSLKTPLAVIQSQKGLNTSSMEQVSIINRIISHQLKRAQSAAGSSWHLGTTVAPIVDQLVGALAKIYQTPVLKISTEVTHDLVFKGDAADLTEILGNLLDNACKAAEGKVLLKAMSSKLELIISIEDDGPGVSEDQESEIFERGMRADSYEQGHGIGLAIVRDLVDSYGGFLSIERSKSLGGAKFSILFKQTT